MRITAASLHLAIYRYWDRLRDGRDVPARAALRPEHLRTLLPHLSLIERDGDGYRYRLCGTAVVEAMGRDLTGTSVGSHVTPAAYAAQICAVYDRVVAGRVPLFTTGEYQNATRVVHAVTRLLLPMADDAGAVTMILVSRASRVSEQPVLPIDWMNAHGRMDAVVEIASVADVDDACAAWEATGDTVLQPSMNLG